MRIVLILMVIGQVAFAFDMGVNIHQGGNSLSQNQLLADVLRLRNIKAVRTDFYSGMNLSLFRDQLIKLKANGVRVEVSLQNSYQWDRTCNSNLDFVEKDSYNQTVTLVNQIKDLVYDFEFLNEVQLRPEILSEVDWNSVGTTVGAYQNKPCVATLMAVLRGMSKAVQAVRASSGLPLRTILGVVGRDFGFLSFALDSNVQFDVVGYHIYPYEDHTSLHSDSWFGSGGPLYQLSFFKKPVHINEFHCGEIYQSQFGNVAGDPLFEQCQRSLVKHLTELKTQTFINLESVHIFELLDEPSKPAPENHFGLMYTLSSPKLNFLVVAAFSGGSLSADEQLQITSRGLLTDSQIQSYRSTIVPPPVTTPRSKKLNRKK